MQRTTTAALLLAAIGAGTATQAQIAPDPPIYVGVIPETAACPDGTSLITIHMDDEDHDNANARSGWIGATTSSKNTTFRVCRVDSRDLKPLAYTNELRNHYAVLKLGSQCPRGTTEFNRVFHNEAPWIGSNINSISSSSGDSNDWGDNICSSYLRRTQLFFCLYKHGTVTGIPELDVDVMGSFPDLGFRYGVFAAPGFSRAVASGWVFTDDEDRNPRNFNQFNGDPDGMRMVKPTNSDGRNTTLYMAKVHPTPPPLTRPEARCIGNPSWAQDEVWATFSDNGSYARNGRSLTTYLWTFSDGSGPDYGPEPPGRYISAGPGETLTFTATLTVTDDFGESASTSCSVSVYSTQPCDWTSPCGSTVEP